MKSHSTPFVIIAVILSQSPISAWGDSAPPPKPAKPLSEGASSTDSSLYPVHPELVIRFGNESNQPDGLFGPLTYGLRGSYPFESGMAIEAGFIRLHEPRSPALSSFVDEAQLTLKTPKFLVLNQLLTLSATAWKNRTIDMYTNVGGIELTRGGALSLNFGAYLGTATRENALGHFTGVLLGISKEFGAFSLAFSHLQGRIDDGFYRKSAVEAAANTTFVKNLPLTFTLSLESRYFNFGNAGPSSEPQDEFIWIFGTEIHWEDLLLHTSEKTTTR